MKTVLYMGKEYSVSSSAKYMATDGDGTVYAYEEKPVIDLDNNMWHSQGRGEIAEPVEYKNWADSCMEVWHPQGSGWSV